MNTKICPEQAHARLRKTIGMLGLKSPRRDECCEGGAARGADSVFAAGAKEFRKIESSLAYEAPLELGAHHFVTVGTNRPIETTVAETLRALMEQNSVVSRDLDARPGRPGAFSRRRH